ncbi:MAG: replication initiation protein [Mucispirillum schaedleri]|nr:replication initiation protein [Mucispirillum schaedleri]
MNKVEESKSVIKSNKLILARFKMTTYEQKIILLCISKIKRNAKKTGTDKFNNNLFFALEAKEISDFLNVNPRTLYKDLDLISNKLMRYEIEIRDDEKKFFEKIRPFPYSKYEAGKFYLRIEQSMEEYLLELKDRFTMYDINNIRRLKSNYSLRIYEILKSYEWVNEYVFNIEEFKQIIGVSIVKDGKIENDLYNRYYDFKKYVLLVAQKELTDNTDISFTFEEIRKGRKVDKIKFYITANKKENEGKQSSKFKKSKEEKKRQKQNESNVDMDDLVDQLREIIKEPLKTKEYKSILQAADNNIKLIEQKYQIAQKQKKIDNLVGWLIAAIQEEYTEPVEKKKISQFNNIESRKYNYSELEKQLLG